MQLDILTPEKKIYSGKVYGIQLPGTEGSFEVLDQHAAMIASLGKGKMKILSEDFMKIRFKCLLLHRQLRCSILSSNKLQPSSWR